MSVFVFPPLGSSTGTLNEEPIATINGNSTGLNQPKRHRAGFQPNIYVADQSEGSDSVFVYPPLGSSTGLLDEPPAATINGPLTELGEPLRIALQPGATPTRDRAPRPRRPRPLRRDGDANRDADRSQLAHHAERGPGDDQLRQRRCDRDQQAQESDAHQQGHERGGDRIGDRDAAIHNRRRRTPARVKAIAAKKKCSFEVEFAPATPNAVTGGSIEVSYNGTSPAVSLSGTGIEVTLKAPSKETFSPVAAGGTGKPKKIKISNPATVSVSLGTTSIGGSDPTAFTITANTCTGTLAAKPGNCTITMEFTPGSGATGAQSATVGFSYTYGANSRSRVDPDLGYRQVDRSRRRQSAAGHGERPMGRCDAQASRGNQRDIRGQ